MQSKIREALENLLSAVDSLAIQYKFPETYKAARAALESESPSPVEVEKLYKKHMEPDEYWYPNSAVVELQREAYKKGFRANHLGEDREGQDELWDGVFKIFFGDLSEQLGRQLDGQKAANELKKNYHLIKKKQ